MLKKIWIYFLFSAFSFSGMTITPTFVARYKSFTVPPPPPTWNSIATLVNPTAEASSFFGFSVSISADGQYALLGAIFENVTNVSQGQAYVFKRTGTSWALEYTFVNPTAEGGSYFGSSVSISGDGQYVLIGAYWEDVTKTNQGQAYVFKRTGTSWALEDTLVNPTAEANSKFGSSVSISADGLYALVGAVDADAYQGRAYVFKRTGTSWALESTLVNPTAETYSDFGHSVSISGDGTYALIGAYYEDVTTADQGQAYVFKRTGTSWALEYTLVNPTTEPNSYFGFSVSISEDGRYALIGAYSEDAPNTDQGQAYIFY